MTEFLCLASASPRRRELLQQIGVAHLVRAADVDERVQPGELPADYVRRLARTKALAVFDSSTAPRNAVGVRLPVLGADTTVVIDERILGKPLDLADCRAMLGRLAGREHEVLSAVALVHEGGSDVQLSRSRVRFRAIDAAEIDRYWASGEPRDKAGAYAIQGLGAVFVEALSGSYSGVMGLPLFETATLLVAAGVPVWQAGA